MKQEGATIQKGICRRVKLGSLVILLQQVPRDCVELLVGRPGSPNVERRLGLGEAMLFETPDDGILEVRVMEIHLEWAAVLISQVSPRLGITGGFVGDDITNPPFTQSELERVKNSLDEIKQMLRRRTDVAAEKLDFICQKLDYMQEASERLGRKDWINLVIGTLTNTVVNAALNPEVAKALFLAAGTALSWLVGGGVKMLQ